MLGEKDIELYNCKFQKSLVGKWISVEGSFFLMSETFEFYSDGTGIWIQFSGSGDCKTYFDWKIERPFVLQIRETKIEDGSEDEPVFESEDYSWREIEYKFTIISNDFGNAIALCNKGSEYFYFSQQRIGFSDVSSIT